MSTWYWICEYGKVLCAYLFLMFLWPRVVFGRHLKGKGKRYQFSFCAVVQVVLVNAVVLGLGLMHLLNQWVVRVLFYGIFIWCLSRRWRETYREGSLATLRRLITGTCGIKLFASQVWRWTSDRLKRGGEKLWTEVKPHFPEYLLLAAAAVYGMIYFSYGAFRHPSYAFSDMYVHHAWVQGLVEGKIFAEGIYPEAMHCFVYGIHTLSGIRIYSILLYLNGIHIIALLFSVYCLLREVFRWKYTPFVALLLFLTTDALGYGMDRFQGALPQEFGLYTQFVCVCFLLRYLRSNCTIISRGWAAGFIWNKELFLFMTALAASLTIHFYPTIMAFFLCLGVVISQLKKVFSRKRFLPLICAAMTGVLIGTVPMAAAYVSGIPFQGSLYWALEVMGVSEEGAEDVEEASREEASEEAAENETGGMGEKWSIIHENYVSLYGETWTKGILWISAGMTGWLAACQIVGFLRKRFFQKWATVEGFDRYMPVILAVFLFMVIYSGGALGLPQLIDQGRLCSTQRILWFTVIVMPLDLLFSLCRLFLGTYILSGVSMACIAGILFMVVVGGGYHRYLGIAFTRYNSAVEITNSIISQFSQNTYTIVSPVDELYQTVGHGYHEELWEFVQKAAEGSYTLPTEYVFLFVEKRPLHYAVYHLLSGPSWLAANQYGTGDECSGIDAGEISEEAAKKQPDKPEILSHYYLNFESRIILESKVYYWCQYFADRQPFTLRTYYEDDNFVCYYFRQNPYAPYELSIEGWDKIVSESLVDSIN